MRFAVLYLRNSLIFHYGKFRISVLFLMSNNAKPAVSKMLTAVGIG